MPSASPVITDMKVVPVAGYDSMLLTLSGAHAPCFTRNLVILTDSAGHTGVGEIHGGEYTYDSLLSVRELVVGRQLLRCRGILRDLDRAALGGGGEGDGEGIQTLDLSKLKYVVKGRWAVECALLDLLGQFLGLPMCELLAQGKQRDRVEVLAYLFFVGDKGRWTDLALPYLDEGDSRDPWFRMRRQTILTPDAVADEAQCLHERYGFTSFKLKGGVWAGGTELSALRKVKERFPQARTSIDPNGAWSLAQAVELCRENRDVLTYVEDPCGPECGYSGREILREFKNAVQLPVATNMAATDWRQFYHTACLGACDIILADPHFWGFEGSVRMAQLLESWGLTWGVHSNNHFDVTLAAFAQVGCAAPGAPAPLDTHWVWQDGQRLTKQPPVIEKGALRLPPGPGLGIELDMERVERAHRLYQTLSSHDRDDALAMQSLIPGWKFDHKRPCMVR